MRKQNRKTVKHLGIYLLTGVVFFAACGSNSAYDMAASTADMAVAEEYDKESFLSMNMGDSVEMPMEPESEKIQESTLGKQGAVSERKLIKTVDLTVETRNFDELIATVESRTKELSGYIENMDSYNGSIYNGGKSLRNADMTIRIPKEQLDTFLNDISRASSVVRQSDRVEDVTLSYVDMESHRKMLRTEQDRLLELLERAESIEDIITIEQRLSEVRYQIESIEAQLRTMDNKVDYSTVHLYINEVEIFTPVQEESVPQRISTGFMETLDDVTEGMVDFFVWFVCSIPVFVVWAVAIAVIVCVIRLVRKHQRKKKKPEQPKQEVNQENK